MAVGRSLVDGERNIEDPEDADGERHGICFAEERGAD